MTAVSPPPRKTLLEWITDDANDFERDQPSDSRPLCTPAVSALHARIGGEVIGSREPVTAPPGFALAPLG